MNGLDDLNELVDRRGLLKYISPNFSDICVLVIESLSYLKELRELMPAAQVMVLTEFRDSQLEFADVNVDWRIGSLKNIQLDENIFDIIIAEDGLTLAKDPYEDMIYISRRLKDTGFLVTEFESVRFIGVLESLKKGYFPVRERRLYAKTEVVRLLNDALFKEISFNPNVTADSADFNVSDWINFGFENFSNELLVKSWIVKASRSTAEVAALKQFYTADIRKELSRIIHRIEYDIEREKNIKYLAEFCEKHQIFDDYLIDFIDSVVVHREAFEFLEL